MEQFGLPGLLWERRSYSIFVKETAAPRHAALGMARRSVSSRA